MNYSEKESLNIMTSTLIILLFIVGIYFVLNKKGNVSIYSLNSINDTSQENNFRRILETEYPEFKDFENQKSFAGKKVKFQMYKDDIYYAYMTLGSGVPIIRANCFRVDKAGQVFKVGIFPDPADPYRSYSDIDPRDCHGIR